MKRVTSLTFLLLLLSTLLFSCGKDLPLQKNGEVNITESNCRMAAYSLKDGTRKEYSYENDMLSSIEIYDWHKRLQGTINFLYENDKLVKITNDTISYDLSYQSPDTVLVKNSNEDYPVEYVFKNQKIQSICRLSQNISGKLVKSLEYTFQWEGDEIQRMDFEDYTPPIGHYNDWGFIHIEYDTKKNPFFNSPEMFLSNSIQMQFFTPTNVLSMDRFSNRTGPTFYARQYFEYDNGYAVRAISKDENLIWNVKLECD